MSDSKQTFKPSTVLFFRRIVNELKLLYKATLMEDLKENVSILFDPVELKLFVEYTGYKGTDFENGKYLMMFNIPPKYPIEQPLLKILTPSGRFDVNSHVSYFVEFSSIITWYNLIIMIINAFSNSEISGIGFKKSDSKTHKELASESVDYNKKNNEKLVKQFDEIRQLKESNDKTRIEKHIKDALDEISKNLAES